MTGIPEVGTVQTPSEVSWLVNRFRVLDSPAGTVGQLAFALLLERGILRHVVLVSPFDFLFHVSQFERGKGVSEHLVSWGIASRDLLIGRAGPGPRLLVHFLTVGVAHCLVHAGVGRRQGLAERIGVRALERLHDV